MLRIKEKIVKLCLFSAVLLASGIAAAESTVNVVGLFNNSAVVVINGGKPKTLKVGESSGDVKLLSANSQFASFEIAGKMRQLSMGQAASVTSGESALDGSVTLYANQEGHFFSTCQINGVALKFILDTGATTVALNSGDAKYANIDYKRGTPVSVSTANGIVTAYRVSIARLKIGNVVLSQVDASVVEGGFPSVVLLGMSALNRLEMKREGIALTLTKKY